MRDKDKWDARYRGGAYAERRHPSALLAAWLPRLELPATRRTALDVACGAGRNALYLARRGWQVNAVDISTVALERLEADAAAERLPVNCMQMDLEPVDSAAERFEGREHDLAVMMRYTNVALVKALADAMRPGGYLLIEKHLETRAEVAGPKNPRFRVAPGALRRAAAGLDIIDYREGVVTDPDGRRVALAQLVGRLPD